jgi:hypothetical protein
MGAVSHGIRKFGRQAGYKVGGAVGSKIGSMTGTSIGEKLGRRVGHGVGKMVGKPAGIAASKAYEKIPIIGSMKKGGPIKKTGLYRLHKGEYVLNREKFRRMRSKM